MTGQFVSIVAAGIAILPGTANPVVANFHDDYYRGFSQGAYYGLMLAGESYDVAWCMKSELEYEAGKFGAGGEFQAMLERLITRCRARYPTPSG